MKWKRVTAWLLACALLGSMLSIGSMRDSGIKANAEETKEETTTTGALATTERKAVWFSYADLTFKNKSKANYTKQIKKMFKNTKSLGMNTVVVHVRPYSDAFYASKYYPWSSVVSKKQGRHPGYDPLKIMVSQAHSLGLNIEAWINPYRITTNSTSIKKLSKNNPARRWYAKKSTRRNVLKYNGQLYYNPSKKAVRKLIVNGVKEIVTNYDVDGIHFDDYFYPSFTKYNYKKVFDAKEYNSYVKKQKKAGKSYKSIANWRKNNINTLVKEVYAAVKQCNPNATFGISPAGNIENLTSRYSYYVDIKKWCSKPGYVDYVCPQIYWGFKNGKASYDKVLKQWLSLKRDNSVKMYVGLAMYRTVDYPTKEWKKSKTIMARSVRYARKTKKVDGFYFFTYSSFTNKKSLKERKNLKKELAKKK